MAFTRGAGAVVPGTHVMSVAVLPYAPAAPAAPGAGLFYRIDHRHFAVSEYRRWTRSPLSILRSKWLGANVRTSSDDPAVVSLAPFEIPAAAVPPEIRAKFDPHLGPLMAAGFHSPVFHFIDDALHATRIYTATLVDPSGRGVAKVQNRIWSVRKPPKDVTFPLFLSATHDGRFVMTSGAEADLNAPPSVDARHLPGAALAVVRAEHERRLTEPSRAAAVPVATADDVRALLDRHHAAIRDFHVGRGVFQPLNDADVRRMAALRHYEQLARAGTIQHPQILAEIDRLQNRKAGWFGMVLIFGLSLGVFILQGYVAKGGMGQSGTFLALVIGVLFVHEMGHYLAMQVFGYKNVRMFFIPGFGAAVSGRHYNVPGWRKAVVSLMGPVPGIFLGIAIGLMGIALHQPLMIQAALLAILLNAFNLLPVLPLDGGWVMHTLFFSRHPVLDGLFRAAAGVGVILLCLALHLKYLMYAGIAMLVSLPVSFKLARIASELQAEGISPISPDDQTIPPDTAERIIAKVKASFARSATNNAVAQHTLKVFELINARPPGVGATLGLSALHGASFVLALIFGLLIFVAQNPQSLRQQWAAAQARAQGRAAMAAPPKYALNPATIHTPDHTPRGATTRKAVVGTFGREAEAQQVYAAATADEAEASLLGRTVAVSFPATDEAARRRWLADFKAHAGSSVFVTRGDRHMIGGAGIRLTCTAPDERTAKQIESDVEDYFGCASLVHAAPPWHPDFGPTEGAKATLRLARHTFKQLNEAGYRPGEGPDPAFKALNDRARRAANEGDTAELKRVQAERAKLNEKLREQDVEKLAHDTSGTVDLALVRLFTSIPRNSTTKPAADDAADEDEDLGPPGFDYKNWREELARRCGPRLGQLPLDGSQPVAGAEAYSASFGSVKHDGTQLTFTWFSFNDPVYGPPTLVRWLAANGCTQFRYEVETPFGERD